MDMPDVRIALRSALPSTQANMLQAAEVYASSPDFGHNTTAAGRREGQEEER
jgi:hypothetical protein